MIGYYAFGFGTGHRPGDPSGENAKKYGKIIDQKN
jgi:hypothetical protein